MIREADTDDDGLVSYEEFKQIMQRILVEEDDFQFRPFVYCHLELSAHEPQMSFFWRWNHKCLKQN